MNHFELLSDNYDLNSYSTRLKLYYATGWYCLFYYMIDNVGV